MGQAAVNPARLRAREADRLPESPLPMWIFHMDGGAIVAANEAATRAYGYTRDELLACRVGDLFPDEVGMLTELRGRASPWTGTLRQRRKDGRTFEVDTAMIEMGGTGPTAIMVIACPVTPGQRPVTPGQREEGDMMPAEAEARAEATPTARAKTLLGRAVAGDRRDGSAALAVVDARELLRLVRERVRLDADARDVDVVVHCSCAPVWVEPESFPEAIYQLLDNAVRATRRGHPVMVDVRDTADGDVLWQIQDAGEGMADEDLARIGQPPHEARPDGRGLGVSLAWRVVEEHHGLLRFESAPGVGTTASIWLPGPHERRRLSGDSPAPRMDAAVR